MGVSRTSLRTLAAGALLALAACGSGGGDGSGKTVLKVADQLGALKTPLDAAGEGKFTDYKVEWSNFVGGPPIIAGQTGGSIDVGWMAETPMIFAQAAGSPVKIVAVSQPAKRTGSGYALVVRRDSPIRNLADLKGRSVAYMKGTVLHYFIARLLEKQGLSLKDIKSIQATSYGTGLLDKGAADAIILTEPFLSQLEPSGKVRVLATAADYTSGFSYLVASDAALADPAKARAIGDLVARTARSKRWQREHVKEAAPSLAKQYNVSPAVAERIIERLPTRYTPIDKNVIAQQQTEADLFLKEGLIRSRLDVSKAFDNRYDAIVAAQETRP